VFVTTTYLRPDSLRHAAALFRVSGGIAAAAAGTPGFVGGRMKVDRRLNFWTVTAWRDATALKAFRDCPAHAPLMPRIGELTSRSEIRTWSEPDARVPRWSAAHARLREYVPDLPALGHPSLSRLILRRRRARQAAPLA